MLACASNNAARRRIAFGWKSQRAVRRSTGVPIMASLKLHYFDGPGRAETSRLILDYGKIPYEDVRFDRNGWMALKPKTPFGQVPVLEIDGKLLAQSSAIDRYTAARAGLLPSDPQETAFAEQWYFFVADIMQLFFSTFSAPDPIAARKSMVEGPFKQKLAKLEEHLADKTFINGDKLCYVDLHVFNALSQWQSGWLEGIPTDYLNEFPAAKAFRNRVASLDVVKTKYAGATSPPYTAYKPDA